MFCLIITRLHNKCVQLHSNLLSRIYFLRWAWSNHCVSYWCTTETRTDVCQPKTKTNWSC